jgi:hypothetical protein
MSKQTYYYAVAGVFLLVGVMHLVRVFSQWDAVIAGVDIPLWVSWAAAAIAGYLAVRGFQFGRRM